MDHIITGNKKTAAVLPLAAAAMIISASALAEELIFRGLPVLYLSGSGSFLGIVFSSAAFAAAHTFGRTGEGPRRMLLRFAYTMSAGLILGISAAASGGILLPFALHCAVNLAAAARYGHVITPLSLYIDPGTGSMLFTVLIGVISAAVYSIRLFAVKLKMRVGSKGAAEEEKTPLVVFSDNKRYWNVFEPVCRELSARGRKITYLTASEDDPVFKCGIENIKAEYIGSGSSMFGRLNNLNASVVLSTTPGLDVYQWKRSAKVDKYVHIPHAASEIVLYRMFGIDYYDSVLLSGKYQEEDIRALESLRKLPAKDLVTVGIPYMDEMAKRFASAGPAPEHPLTVLLAPSWGKSAIFSVYGGKIIDVLLKTGYHVIVRPHPQSAQSEKELLDGIMAAHPTSDRLEWNFDTDNFEVLRRSDILVSDFSGVIFDFTLIYDKPVIYTDPDIDLSLYDAWWLDKPLWTASALPRLGRMLTDDNMEDLKSLIDECLTDPRYEQGRKEVKAETWAFPGLGAKKAADYIESLLSDNVKKEDK